MTWKGRLVASVGTAVIVLVAVVQPAGPTGWVVVGATVGVLLVVCLTMGTLDRDRAAHLGPTRDEDRRDDP